MSETAHDDAQAAHARASDYLLAKVLQTIHDETRTVGDMVAGTEHTAGSVSLGVCLVAAGTVAGASFPPAADPLLNRSAAEVFAEALESHRRTRRADATVVDDAIRFGEAGQ